jgi:subtilisin family serine protease
MNDLLLDSIKIEHNTKKNVINNMNKPVIYSPLSYGINNLCTGKKVKIAILDSGCPHHKDIRINGDAINLCEENVDLSDQNGHATMLAGIINANNKKTIMGLAPHAEIIYGKIINNKNICGFNSLVAGVLWAIVQEVDIIVIALGTQYDYAVLRDAVKKARDRGICVFAAAGDKNINIEWEIDFPARYEHVISNGFLKRIKIQNDIVRKKVDFYLPNKGLYTTYLNNKYIKATGSSISSAFYAGLAAVLIEQYKGENKKDIPTFVYKRLKNIQGELF